MTVEQFIEAKCERSVLAMTPGKLLWDAYTAACAESDSVPLVGRKGFAQGLQRAGYPCAKQGSVRYHRGVVLR